MILTLHSVCGPDATIGTLNTDHQSFYTIELPWRENLANLSCVPGGTYELLPYDSPSHGPTWCLHNPALNVYGNWPCPEGGRSSIEIHAANWATQLLGCIALGIEDQPLLDPGTGEVEPAVENSRDAVAELIAILGALSVGHSIVINRA